MEENTNVELKIELPDRNYKNFVTSSSMTNESKKFDCHWVSLGLSIYN